MLSFSLMRLRRPLIHAACRLILPALLLASHAALAQVAGSSYTLVRLPVPVTFTSPFATSLSASGQVAGTSEDAFGNGHAFLWDLATGLTDLGTLPGGTGSWAYAMNNKGQVVGEALAADGLYHPFLWSASTGMTDLGFLPGGSIAAATAINALGQVTGWSNSASGYIHAFLWSASTGMTDLGALPGGTESYGHAINNAGLVAGWASNSDSNDDGFVWSASAGMQRLTPPPGAGGSAAYAINDSGQVVGEYFKQAVGGPFLWDATHGMLDLGMPPGTTEVTADWVNNKGQVVGWARSSNTLHIYLWSKATGMVDLGWSGYAGGINDAGQIAFSDYDTSVYLAYPYSLTLLPAQVDPNKSTKGSVAIPFPAVSNIKVPLTCDQSAVTLPASVTIPAGKTSVTFSIGTAGVPANTVANIDSTYQGWTFSTPLTIPAGLSSLALSSKQLTAGDTAQGILTLQAAAAGDTVVTLSSNNTAVTVPTSVIVPAGSSTASFQISCDPAITSSASVAVRATCGGASRTASISALPVNVSSVSLSASSVTTGTKVTGTVTLSTPAPADLTITLTGQSGGITYPASVIVPAGGNSAAFPIRSTGVNTATLVSVTATSTLNRSSASANLTMQPSIPFGMSLSPWTVVAGQSSTLTVTLTSPAPSGGLTFALASSNTAAANFATPTLAIAAGQTTGTAAVTGSLVFASTPVVMNATLGSTAHNVQLTVAPTPVISLALSPGSVVGGASCTATVTLSAPAPVAMALTLASSDAAASVPATVTVPAGSSTATFTVTTQTITSIKTVTLSAAYGSRIKHATLRVTPTISP